MKAAFLAQKFCVGALFGVIADANARPVSFNAKIEGHGDQDDHEVFWPSSHSRISEEHRPPLHGSYAFRDVDDSEHRSHIRTVWWGARWDHHWKIPHGHKSHGKTEDPPPGPTPLPNNGVSNSGGGYDGAPGNDPNPPGVTAPATFIAVLIAPFRIANLRVERR